MKDTVRIEGIGAQGIFTAELVDVDQDGYVDLLAAGHEDEDYFSTRILWGNSSGVFSTLNETILPAIHGLGTVVDIDVADTDARRRQGHCSESDRQPAPMVQGILRTAA